MQQAAGASTYLRWVTFPGATSGKEHACQHRRHETWVWSLGWEDPLEKGMATQSSSPSWRIPWTEELGGLVHGVTKSWTWLKQLNSMYFDPSLMEVSRYSWYGWAHSGFACISIQPLFPHTWNDSLPGQDLLPVLATFAPFLSQAPGAGFLITAFSSLPGEPFSFLPSRTITQKRQQAHSPIHQLASSTQLPLLEPVSLQTDSHTMDLADRRQEPQPWATRVSCSDVLPQ